MMTIKDKMEYLIAFLLGAGGLFLGGVFIYHLINITIITISTILYIIYLIIGCVFYKIGVLILGF